MFAVGRATATAAATGRRFINSSYVNTVRGGVRSFSSGDGTGDNNNNNNKDKDPYGLNYDDGPDGLGPEDKFPPRYVRDQLTGSMTGEKVRELSQRDKELLEMNEAQKLEQLTKQVQGTLSQKEAQEKLAKHVLSSDVLKSKEVRANHPQRHQWEALQKKYLKALEQKEKVTERDFQKTHNRAMTDAEKKYHNLLDTHGLHDSALDQKDGSDGKSESVTIPDEWAHPDKNPSNPWAEENLAWVANDVNEGVQSNEMEFMPPELVQGPNTKLNRRQATLIPIHLRHHNNLALLRKYMTPGGQIMPRTQTRLGAKDQRKMASLIKRARNMGLIPTIGQWKVHDHGDLTMTMSEARLGQDEKQEQEQKQKQWEQVFEKAGLFDTTAKTEATSAAQATSWADLLKRGKEAGVVEADDTIPLKDDLFKVQAKLLNIKLVNKE